MNRGWITALTLATVAGSAGAFAGVVANSNDSPAAAQSPAPFDATAFVRAEPQAPSVRTVSYQVGAAGTVTLSLAGGSLVVDSASPGSGWSIATASGPGTHIDVQFTDGTQLVTFSADAAGTDITVSVTNLAVAAPTALVAADTTTPMAAAVTTPTTTAATPRRAASPTTSPTTVYRDDHSDDGDDDHEAEHDDD